MPRPVGNRNDRPGTKERRQMIATLRKNAEQGDSLAILGLLLFAAKSPFDRKDSTRETPVLNVCD